MHRVVSGSRLLVLLVALGCGSRTDLLGAEADEPDPETGGASGAGGRGSNLGGAGRGGVGGRDGFGGNGGVGGRAGFGGSGFGGYGGYGGFGGYGFGGYGGYGFGGYGFGGYGGYGFGGYGGYGFGGYGGYNGFGGYGGGAGGYGGYGGGAGGFGGMPPLATRCELMGDDPRVTGIKPDEVAELDAADFVVGDVRSYRWTVEAEDCDAVVQDAQFVLEGANSRVVKFQPSRPSFYHFTLDVVGVQGDRASCKLSVPVEGVGMRVELCWDTSTSTDLDLYLHQPADRAPWFSPGATSVASGLDRTTCNTSNCSAVLRLSERVDWGYADSPLSACNTPSFQGFAGLGRCTNPRAADDNNQQIANGTTERVQLDNPQSGQTFRVMAQNFSNAPAQPHVFVYCGGQRAGAFRPRSTLDQFVAPNPGTFGVMWRAADITTQVDAAGNVSCSAASVTERPAVSIDDPTF